MTDGIYKKCQDCPDYQVLYDSQGEPVGHRCNTFPKCRRSTRLQQIEALKLDELRQINNWLQQINKNLSDIETTLENFPPTPP